MDLSRLCPLTFCENGNRERNVILNIKINTNDALLQLNECLVFSKVIIE